MTDESTKVLDRVAEAAAAGRSAGPALAPAEAPRRMPGVAAATDGRAGATRLPLMMTTAVWGDWFIGMLLDVNLPTLLAPGNLPALSRRCAIHYVLFTRSADRERLERAPEIEAMRRYMTIEIRLLADADLADPIATHHRCWKIVTEEASEARSRVLLMPPDVAWSENAFETVARHIERGTKAIFMTYLRAESETFAAAIRARRNPADVALAMSGLDLVETCVRSLHPLMAAYLRQSDYFPTHSEMMLWAVPQEGFLARIFAREMFVYTPGELKLNHAALPAVPFAPGEAVFITDSDELFAVSLAPLGKDIAWHLEPRRADPVDMAGWWLTYDSPANDFHVAHKLRWHFAPVTEAKWRAVELGSDLFVRRSAGAREAMRLWQSAREHGCANTALLLATAAHVGTAARAMRGRGPAIVLLPTEEAFAGRRGLVDRLLDPAHEGALIRLMRAHHVPDCSRDVLTAHDPLGELLDEREAMQLATGRGAVRLARSPRGGYEIGGVRVRAGAYRAGLHRVYLVDGLLADDLPGAR